MPVCHSCATPVPAGDEFCPKCLARGGEAAERPTRTEAPRRSTTSSGAMDEGRFPPGTVLAQRYRIVNLLGRGGMGEVYRANDLLLGQPVALKFLSPALAADEAALNRFRAEVRIARQVSHRNVCRVYDIGEAEGLTYLSMEYVDGEDLASLLRRIGRLPQDKAVEIARKLCAGLAAAHATGVVHRDLKPSNIMLDGQGQVRITDFGLATFAEQVRDLRSGTPAYMAPEQLAGREVTTRSDIYALGVVLHELFTGKAPFADGKPELDPAIELVIRRCLNADPQKRPATALAVAAALPGGDPLAAALEAGETPTPEMVANAGDVEGFRVPVAAACMAAVIVGLAALCVLRLRVEVFNQIPLDNAPAVLAAKAREIAKSFGHANRPVDTAFGWRYAMRYLRYVRRQPDAAARWTRLSANRPPAVHFWYRESPRYLIPLGVDGVTQNDPPALEPGMITALLDSEGRLISFDARPPQMAEAADRTKPPDWGILFSAAGLDAAQFTPAPPAWTPPVAFDARMAWTGAWPGDPKLPLRVEAAAYQGRPVFFRLISPWDGGGTGSPPQRMFVFVLIFVIGFPAVAALLSWRNIRLGRGDPKGAWRLAGFAFACSLVEALLESNHILDLSETTVLTSVMRWALLAPAVFWVLYMAFEPYMRRRWPATLISWTRLLEGRFRDPLLGAHVLAGVVLGIATCLLNAIAAVFAPFGPSGPLEVPVSTSACLAAWLSRLYFAVGSGLSLVFLLFLLRLTARRAWIAGVLFIAVNYFVAAPEPGVAFPARALIQTLIVAVGLYAVVRFGVVAMMTMFFVNDVLSAFPLTLRFSEWYAEGALLALGTVLALALYAFHTTLAGRPVWPEKGEQT